jgi:hypothetical protein
LLAFTACDNTLLGKAQAARSKAESPVLTIKQEGGAELAPDALVDFGAASIDESKDIVLTVGNAGAMALSLPETGIALGGTDAASWSLAAAPPASLAPGTTATLTLRFKPATLGDKSATVSFSTNDMARPVFSLALKGSGTDQAATPVVQGGNLQSFKSGSCTVTLTCATEGATIYYTTDKSSPDPANPGVVTKEYTAPFLISFMTADCTVKAVAIAPGRSVSKVVTAVFTKNALQAPEITPSISYVDNYYPGDAPLQFTVTSASSNALILFSVDGTDPQANDGATNINTTAFETDSSGIHILDNGGTLTYAGTHAGGSFILKVSAYSTDAVPSSTVSATYNFKAATPTFDSTTPPATAYYPGLSQVKLSCANMVGFSVKYTIDDTLPATSGTAASGTVGADGLVSVGLPVPAAGSSAVYKVRAYALMANWLDSAVLYGEFPVCGAGVWSNGSDNSKWDQATWQP